MTDKSMHHNDIARRIAAALLKKRDLEADIKTEIGSLQKQVDPAEAERLVSEMVRVMTDGEVTADEIVAEMRAADKDGNWRKPLDVSPESVRLARSWMGI